MKKKEGSARSKASADSSASGPQGGPPVGPRGPNGTLSATSAGRAELPVGDVLAMVTLKGSNVLRHRPPGLRVVRQSISHAAANWRKRIAEARAARGHHEEVVRGFVLPDEAKSHTYTLFCGVIELADRTVGWLGGPSRPRAS